MKSPSSLSVGAANRSLARVASALVVSSGLVAGCGNASGSASDSITDLVGLADQANARFQVRDEERHLRAALSLDGTDGERAEARRKLARVRWKFYLDYEEASDLLSEAVDVGAEESKAWAELSRMERKRGRLDEAVAAAERAVDAADDAFETRGAVMALSTALIDLVALRWLDEGNSVSEATAERFARALDLQQSLVRDQPGDLDASRALLSLAVIQGVPESAVEAWRGYYYVSEDDPGPGLVAEAGARLDELYEGWVDEETPVAVRSGLVEALSASRFHLEAALAAADPRAADRQTLLALPRVREIVAYGRFCRRVAELTEEFYRLEHLGRGSHTTYHRHLAEASDELWADLDEPTMKPPLRDGRTFSSSIRSELGPRFGAFGRLTNAELYFGHAIMRDTRTVEQYGHRGSVSYTVIDHMVSNGYQTWAWSDTTEVGGWATSNTIVKVRSALIRETVHVWDLVSSEQERAALVEKMERDSASEDERVRRDGVVHLPGLHMRVALRAIDDLVDSLRARGVTEEALRMAVIKELLLLADESGIFAHEGRHAIDLTLDPSQRSSELEFTAKLSQVAFSRAPRIAVIGILGPALGADTPHGRANLMFARGAVEWMKAHEDEIEGFDPSRPHFPQFDLLTDGQLVEVARSMDPLVE